MTLPDGLGLDAPQDFRPGLDDRMRELRELVEDHGETVLTDRERDFWRLYRLLETAETRVDAAMKVADLMALHGQIPAWTILLRQALDTKAK